MWARGGVRHGFPLNCPVALSAYDNPDLWFRMAKCYRDLPDCANDAARYCSKILQVFFFAFPCFFSPPFRNFQMMSIPASFSLIYIEFKAIRSAQFSSFRIARIRQFRRIIGKRFYRSIAPVSPFFTNIASFACRKVDSTKSSPSPSIKSRRHCGPWFYAEKPSATKSGEFAACRMS